MKLRFVLKADILMAMSSAHCVASQFLGERGRGLQAGQAVITGSYAGALELPLGRQLDIGFGAFGALPIRFLLSE